MRPYSNTTSGAIFASFAVSDLHPWKTSSPHDTVSARSKACLVMTLSFRCALRHGSDGRSLSNLVPGFTQPPKASPKYKGFVRSQGDRVASCSCCALWLKICARCIPCDWSWTEA